MNKKQKNLLIRIIIAAVLTSMPSIFLQRALRIIGDHWQSGDWAAAQPEIAQVALSLIGVYVLALAANITTGQLGAIVTQGCLDGAGLALVVEGRAGAVGVDIEVLVVFEASLFEG